MPPFSNTPNSVLLPYEYLEKDVPPPMTLVEEIQVALNIAHALVDWGKANLSVDNDDGNTLAIREDEEEPEGFGGDIPEIQRLLESDVSFAEKLSFVRNWRPDKATFPTYSKQHLIAIKADYLGRIAVQQAQIGDFTTAEQTFRLVLTGVSHAYPLDGTNDFENADVQTPILRRLLLQVLNAGLS